MNYFVKTPKILRSLYTNAVWSLPNSDNKIYLTFDDGPCEDITASCLDILKNYGVTATFFCVGDNVRKNSNLYNRILEEGHAVGNHSFNHLKGWETRNEEYFSNVDDCAKMVESNLFRPPYGKAKRSQLKELSKDYRIIMWDVLSGDFDPKMKEKDVVNNVLNNTESGSVIVMHDNEKCGKKMLNTLPQIIEGLRENGFSFEKII